MEKNIQQCGSSYLNRLHGWFQLSNEKAPTAYDGYCRNHDITLNYSTVYLNLIHSAEYVYIMG